MSSNSGAEVATKTKPRPKSTHPPVSKMVDDAILSLCERTGSSLHAIKKFISANFIVADIEKLSHLIKKYLRKSVDEGHLLQTKGIGANGSFKLSIIAKQALKKASQPPKPKVEKKAKSSAVSSSKAKESNSTNKVNKDDNAAKRPKPKSSALPKDSNSKIKIPKAAAETNSAAGAKKPPIKVRTMQTARKGTGGKAPRKNSNEL